LLISRSLFERFAGGEKASILAARLVFFLGGMLRFLSRYDKMELRCADHEQEHNTGGRMTMICPTLRKNDLTRGYGSCSLKFVR
jgi:hypothetical protein